MQIRQLVIKNFRGIGNCLWTPDGQFLCLVGHGDSTKSTILDAIELALSPRSNLTLSETDFHGLDLTKPIEIVVTLGDLPDSLIGVNKFGLHLRGWSKEQHTLVDEPADDLEEVLCVRFTVDDSLEPSWTVFSDRNPEGQHLSVRDREAFGLVRITSDFNRHLTWSRGSALAQATEKGDTSRLAIIMALQSARKQVEAAELSRLQEAAKKAEQAAKQAGAIVANSYRPSLYLQYGQTQQSTLALYDGEVPLISAGLGTRRLVALGLQALAIAERSIVLVDEIENGLEPHRLRHLLATMRPAHDAGQVIFTTHSAVALIELNATDIHFVSSAASTTHVLQASSALQPITRAMPEAFLAKRVLVAEGRTELGITRGLEEYWKQTQGGLPLTHKGAVVVDGGGETAQDRANKLHALGLRVAMLTDSDKDDVSANGQEDDSTGIPKFAWFGQTCSEERIALDLPLEQFEKLVQCAAEDKSEDAVRAKVGERLPDKPTLRTITLSEWIASGRTEEIIRKAFGYAAAKGGWFKSIDGGEKLGRIIAEALPSIPDSPLAKTLDRVAKWLYE